MHIFIMVSHKRLIFQENFTDMNRQNQQDLLKTNEGLETENKRPQEEIKQLEKRQTNKKMMTGMKS